MNEPNTRRLALTISGYGGSAVPNTYLQQQHDTDHLGILLPGLAYSCDRPLLYYPGRLLRTLGADILRVEAVYGLDTPAGDMINPELVRRAQGDAAAAYRVAVARRPYRRLTLVGKSLGTLAGASVLGLSGVPEWVDAIWLTPVLATLLDARLLGAITARQPRCFIAIGTRDPLYDEGRLAQWRTATGSAEVIVPDADHALEIPGDVVKSAQELARLMQTMQAFLTHAQPH